MHLTAKSGIKIILPSDDENFAIQQGIDADPDTFEVTDFSKLKKIGSPVGEKTKDRVNIRLDK